MHIKGTFDLYKEFYLFGSSTQCGNAAVRSVQIRAIKMVYMCVCVVCVRMCICVCMCVVFPLSNQIHICIYVTLKNCNTHTYTHTHTHTHTHAQTVQDLIAMGNGYEALPNAVSAGERKSGSVVKALGMYVCYSFFVCGERDVCVCVCVCDW